jgi:hypothetical protein
MAARKPKAKAVTSSLFALAERQIVGLYDAGVLSPAVLHHVIAAYANSAIDWSEAASLRTVDDRSVHEAVVLTMMPGRPLRSAQKDFMSVVEHLAAGAGASAKAAASSDEAPEDDEALLDQLGGKSKSKSSSGTASRSSKASDEPSQRKSAGFNPLVGARGFSTHYKG